MPISEYCVAAVIMMKYMSISEASNEWKISVRSIRVLCSEGRIEEKKARIDKHRPLAKGLADSLHEKLIIEWTYNNVLDHAHTTMDYQPFLELVAGLVMESEQLWLSLVE